MRAVRAAPSPATLCLQTDCALKAKTQRRAPRGKQVAPLFVLLIWVWLKIEQEGLRGFGHFGIPVF